jgi:hypothetical protein
MKSPRAPCREQDLFLLLCVMLATISLTLFVSPVAGQTKLVYGANNPAVDVAAVQSAVDQGGLVILKGTFDFGSDAGNHIIVPGRAGAAQDVKGKSTVFIYKQNVTILGATDKRGNLTTVVKNGMPPFWMGWDGNVTRTQPEGVEGVDYGRESFPQDAEGRVDYRDIGPDDPQYAGPQTRFALAFQNVSATIRNIYFDSPKHYGVKATAGQNIVVIGNVFRNVQFGGLVHGNGLFTATHVAVAGVGGGFAYAPFVYPAITGSIDIENNVVDDVGTEAINTHAGECYGLGALATNATVTMNGNEIRNIGRKANGAGSDVILAGGLLLIDNYGGSPLVTRNIVRNSLVYGIWDLVAIAPTPGPTIRGNTFIDCGVSAIQTESAIGPREGVKIDANFVFHDGLLGSGQACITGNSLSGALMRWNTFSGSYSGPLVALHNASNCKLLLNTDLRRTIPSWAATYFLDIDSSGNLIVGMSGTAVDMGSNNTIILPGQGGKH